MSLPLTCVVLASEPSISQLIDVIGQNQLETLKESAEECLDLQVSKETEKDKVPVTQWEAELKKEVSPAAVKCLMWSSLCDRLRQGCDSSWWGSCSGGVGEGRGRAVGRTGGLLESEMVFSCQLWVSSCSLSETEQQKNK